MILEALKRKHVNDDKLWEMVNRANKLTTGSYSSWVDNAATLVPLMERILLRSKENEEWKVYVYAMSKLFWLVRRAAGEELRRAFRLSEMFHQDCAQNLGEKLGRFEREWLVDMAAQVLGFYLDYPQIDDAKIEQMLNIFLDNEQRYGSSWNYGDYEIILRYALLNRDKKLAETAKKKLSRTDFSLWCYICYYGKPVIRCYVLDNDIEGIEEMISSLCEKSIPADYQWCYTKCESKEKEVLVGEVLRDCMKYGTSELFGQIFDRWSVLYQEPEKGEVRDTHDVLFHALAGDWSREDDRLRLAEDDDRDAREHKETPLEMLYWALCWHCYFRILDRNGTKTVRIRLGGTEDKFAKDGQAEDKFAEDKEKQEKENLPERLCLDVAEYFERQADELGAQMDRARKRFDYARVKRTYEECLLNTAVCAKGETS